MEKKSLSGKRLLLGAETVRTGIRDTDENFFFHFVFQLFHLSLERIRKPEGLEECNWIEVMDLCKHALFIKEKGKMDLSQN